MIETKKEGQDKGEDSRVPEIVTKRSHKAQPATREHKKSQELTLKSTALVGSKRSAAAKQSTISLLNAVAELPLESLEETNTPSQPVLETVPEMMQPRTSIRRAKAS